MHACQLTVTSCSLSMLPLLKLHFKNSAEVDVIVQNFCSLGKKQNEK